MTKVRFESHKEREQKGEEESKAFEKCCIQAPVIDSLNGFPEATREEIS